jgi:iron complex outermembrane recepter protein
MKIPRLGASVPVLGGLLAGVPLLLSSSGLAAQTEPERDASPIIEQVVVTGSRLRRDEFTSISPIQVLDAAGARRLGLVDAGAIIADSPVVTGAQFDNSVVAGSTTAAVEGLSPTGLGGQAVALRGLGPERTLLLVNGRRLAPSGVRGAPVAPDLNLIPATMIDRIEVLTDGASSIYGADAVAGVANVILRQDMQGLEFTGFQSLPEDDGGGITQIGLIGGASSDRGNFTIAVEYYDRERVTVGDRKGFNDCIRDILKGDDGETYSVCLDPRPANAALIASRGFIFLEPGLNSPGLPANWITNADLLAAGTNFRLTDRFTLQDSEREGNLLEELSRVNLYSLGRWDLDLFSRDTIYFEASYSQRDSTGRFPREQVFPGVPGFIPREFIPTETVIVDGEEEERNLPPELMVGEDGLPLLFPNPLNPFGEDALPVITLADFPQRRTSDLSNYRFVLGLEGDLAFGALGRNNWVYDMYVSYDRSMGTSDQPIIVDSNLRESLYTLRFNADGDLICGMRHDTLNFGFPNRPACVVVDFFSPTLFTNAGGTGRFATPEERDYLIAKSITSTEIEQSVVSLVATGDLFDLPAGRVGLVLGAEFREQSIRSITDAARSLGLAASEVPDIEGDTIGRTSLWELFAETEIPIVDQFLVNLSGRYTNEENFGSEFTYSVKADFAPTDWLRFRGSIGTTFRAPNLREQFLAGAAGTIAGTADPCLVPLPARGPGNVYLPDEETRDQVILDNCVAAGVDPTALGLLAQTGVPITTGGNPDAEAETSDSFTLGVVFSQPWWENFDLQVSVTYFDIEIENTLRESSAARILADCYSGSVPLQDPNCARITRNVGNPATAVVSNVDASFINVGEVTSKGFDFNAVFSRPVTLFNRDMDLAISAVVTRQTEQKEQVDDQSPVRDFAGTISLPKWRGNGSIVLSSGSWTGLWRTRFIGGGQAEDKDDFPFTTFGAATTACGVLGAPAGVLCRRVDSTSNYWQHDISLSYSRDVWSATLGVINLFEEEPPLIDQGRGPARMNIVVQSGHDLIGRRAFLNLERRF